MRRAASRAGRAISRSYQARTRAQAPVISASSRAKSTAPAQRANVAPAGPASAAGSVRPRTTAQAALADGATGRGRSPSSRTPCGGSAADRAERGERRARARARSTSGVPRRLAQHQVLHDEFEIDQPAAPVAQIPRRGARRVGQMRRRMSATSATRRSGSRGAPSAARSPPRSARTAPDRRRSAGARVSAMCSQVQADFALILGKAARLDAIGPDLPDGRSRISTCTGALRGRRGHRR